MRIFGSGLLVIAKSELLTAHEPSPCLRLHGYFCADGSGFPEPPLRGCNSNPRRFRPRPPAVSLSWCGIRLQPQAEEADQAGAGFPGFWPALGLGARRRHGQWAAAAHGGGL